jgi:predicted oxidoreductase
MKNIQIGNSEMTVSAIALGCWRISSMTVAETARLIDTALDEGINFFDHADIYGGGQAEELFGKAIGDRAGLRDQICIQSKCGIQRGYYDLSKDHILKAVDGSLRRLKTDYLDILLLHRPDTLMEPEEVAAAFTILQNSGKVRHFGVSNMNPMQIELLSQSISQKILVNQLQMSIAHSGMIDADFNVNTKNDLSINRDGGILEYCRLKNITIQPWSPLQYGFNAGTFVGNDQYAALNLVLDRLAEDRGVSSFAIAIAWLLRHPAGLQPIVGTTRPEHLATACKAAGVELTRPEWYEIYRAAGNKLP